MLSGFNDSRLGPPSPPSPRRPETRFHFPPPPQSPRRRSSRAPSLAPVSETGAPVLPEVLNSTMTEPNPHRHMTAPPEPAVLTASMAHRSHKMLQYMRKFDGTGDPSEFLDHYLSDVREVGRDHRFALENFDRVLEGNAKVWFSSCWPDLHQQLRDGDREPVHIWGRFANTFVDFWDQKARKSNFQRKNRELRYKLGDDPDTYVISKLELLKGIDPFMSDADKVEKLIRGLPSDLEVSFTLQGIRSPLAFLAKLRKIGDLRSRRVIQDASIELQALATPIPPTPVPAPLQPGVPYRATAPPRPQNDGWDDRTPSDQPICWFCRTPGHILRYCRRYATHLQRGGQPHSGPNRFFSPQNQFRGPRQASNYRSNFPALPSASRSPILPNTNPIPIVSEVQEPSVNGLLTSVLRGIHKSIQSIQN